MKLRLIHIIIKLRIMHIKLRVMHIKLRDLYSADTKPTI